MNNRSVSASDPVRTLFTIGVTGSMSDGELLGRYLDGRAEEAECAFAALVDRHGRMVRHVCRAILGDDHDAGDAFQAIFLVLARRARTIRDAESVGPWLFGVARRVALRARSDASRRRKAERSKAEQDAPRLVTTDALLPDDWAPLFEELDRLPARYRDPLILCYLEGHSHDQAAALLGCPAGTLRTRLARAKDRLRARLTRRGLSPTPILAPLSAAVSPQALLPLPTGWAAAASRLALAARGLPIASLSVPLAVSTLRSMTMIALTRSIALGSVAVLGLGTGLAGLSATSDGPAAPPRVVSTPPAPTFGVVDLQEPNLDPNPPIQASGDQSPGDQSPGPNAVTSRSEVEGEVTVIMLLEPGTPVTEGQLVAELDSSVLKDQLANQQIATEQANADYFNAIKTREIDEVNVEHFIKGTYPFERRMLLGEIEIAQAELDLARSRFDQMAGSDATARIELDLGRSRPGFAPAPADPRFEVDPGRSRPGFGPPPADGVEAPQKPDFASMPIQHQEARIEILRAELSLKKAEGALEVLENYTRDREVKALEGNVERSKSDELAKQSRFELEKEKEEKLRRMIETCKLYAPAEGILRHPAGVFEGGTVKERQILFWIDRPLAEGHPVDEAKAEAEIEAGSKQSEVAEVRQQMRGFTAELRTRFSRDEPLTEEERASYRLRYEHARDRYKEASGRPDLPNTDFETFLKFLGLPGKPDR